MSCRSFGSAAAKLTSSLRTFDFPLKRCCLCCCCRLSLAKQAEQAALDAQLDEEDRALHESLAKQLAKQDFSVADTMLNVRALPRVKPSAFPLRTHLSARERRRISVVNKASLVSIAHLFGAPALPARVNCE